MVCFKLIVTQKTSFLDEPRADGDGDGGRDEDEAAGRVVGRVGARRVQGAPLVY